MIHQCFIKLRITAKASTRFDNNIKIFYQWIFYLPKYNT